MANWKEVTERWLPIVEKMEEHSMDDYAIPEIYRAAEHAIDELVSLKAAYYNANNERWDVEDRNAALFGEFIVSIERGFALGYSCDDQLDLYKKITGEEYQDKGD